MFKAIKALLSATNSALDITTSVLNEVSDGLNSMNKSLESYSERRTFLKELCRLIYENKLTKNEAIQQIQEKIGDEYISEFDNNLERYCEAECQACVYKIFPNTEPTGSIEKYFSENNEELFTHYLHNKYGVMYQKVFFSELKERKKQIIKLCLSEITASINPHSEYQLECLNNNELNLAYWRWQKEFDKRANDINDKFKEISVTLWNK